MFNEYFRKRATQLIPLYAVVLGYTLLDIDLWLFVYGLTTLIISIRCIDVLSTIWFLLGNDTALKNMVIGRALWHYKYAPDELFFSSFANNWMFDYLFWLPLSYLMIINGFDYGVISIAIFLALSGALAAVINTIIVDNIDYLRE